MSRAEKFDARAYFLSTVCWFDAWPNRAIEQFEEAGFTRIRLEKIAFHPVWHLRMQAPSPTVSSRKAARRVRKVVEQAGTIPRGGFFCSVNRQGRVEAAFVLDA